MRQLDVYDPRAAFSDLYQRRDGGIALSDYDCSTEESCAEAARAIMLCAIRHRRGGVRHDLYDSDTDTTVATFETGGAQTIVGDVQGLPIFSGLRQKFSTMVHPSKQVRVDDESSYADFRQARRVPYQANLEARVAVLERALKQHASDGHGAAMEDFADSANQIIGDALARTRQGGERINLPLRECREGVIECWLDGPEILCSVYLLRSDGSKCIATAGESCARALDEVVGCAMEIDVEPEELTAIAPQTAKVLGATGLIRQICGAAHSLVRQEPPYVGTLEPGCDPNVAAAMALIQRCWMGDRWCCVEALRLERLQPQLTSHAIECLQKARML